MTPRGQSRSAQSLILWSMIAWIFLVGTLASCGSLIAHRSVWLPPETFSQAALLGTWTRVNPIYASEAITLNADHTFTQSYDQLDHTLHFETHGSWQVEPRASGCSYLHLEGMRNFALTDSDASYGNRFPDGTLMSFWEPCEDRLITMPDRVTLIIGTMPNFPRGLVLLFPRNGAESGDVMMWLNEPTKSPTSVPQ